MSDYTIYCRRPDLTLEGQIDDFSTCELIPRFNDVGSWQLELDYRSRMAAALAQPGYGIEVWRRDTDLVMSGPLIKFEREKRGDRNRLVVSGRDDNVWLQRRLASPQPATAAPPYSTTEHDVRTAVASTVLRQYVDVNLGPSAVVGRRVSGLTLAADPVLGPSITGRARWQNLLELLQGLAVAGGGLGFRVRKSGGGLVFNIYQPTDKSASVRFTEDLGTLAGFRYTREVPELTYDVIGGGGEGTARTIREAQDAAGLLLWGRIERFDDRRDTTVAGELDQDLAKNLAEGAERTGISIEPIDTVAQQYLTHYDLGDRVLAVVDGRAVPEVIREVNIKLTPEGPQRVLPVIGSTGRNPVLAVFTQLRKLGGRVRNLERR